MRAPDFFRGLHTAANGGPINILALSGGGSGGAFGAGALVGLTRAHARPQFELVTGVSVGALISPFAFLGPEWDAKMQQAFSGNATSKLLRSPRLTMLARMLFPRGVRGHSPLFDLVDHFVTAQMIAAVAHETEKGRQLIVATTDLDKQETVLWDMGAIAQRGGTSARELFRDVLMASASVPGIFPPMLIHVRENGIDYDELHVDAGVTTSVFTTPLIVDVRAYDLPQLRGGNIYLIVDGKLARTPQTTPVNTLAIISSSFSAETTYKTREAIIDNIAAASRLGMTFHLTEIPVDYPPASFIDFDPHRMQALFGFAADCAAHGRLWLTAAQSIQRNMHPQRVSAAQQPDCPFVAADSGN
ncbi:MAG: patatin-like phospholipase family protein [Dokdonella sp.]